MASTKAADFTGLTVVVTRPAHQAGGLAGAIEAAGGRVLRFPVVAIAPPPNPAAAQAKLADLKSYDWVIFVSANAVSAAFALAGGTLRPGPRTRLAAIGAATAAALTAQGLPLALRPAQEARSETLLDTERFADHFATDDGPPAPVFVVEGRTYPVEVRYRPYGAEHPTDADDRRDQVRAVIDAIDELETSDYAVNTMNALARLGEVEELLAASEQVAQRRIDQILLGIGGIGGILAVLLFLGVVYLRRMARESGA